MSAKKSLWLEIAKKYAVATIATKSANGRYFTESKKSLIYVPLPLVLIDTVEQCFQSLGVTNTARYCDDGTFFIAPIVDLSEVWITPAAHQFFANKTSSEYAHFLIRLAAHLNRYTGKVDSQHRDRDFSAVWKELAQEHPIAACRVYFQINRQESLGIRTVMYAQNIECLSDAIAML